LLPTELTSWEYTDWRVAEGWPLAESISLEVCSWPRATALRLSDTPPALGPRVKLSWSFRAPAIEKGDAAHRDGHAALVGHEATGAARVTGLLLSRV
jgi:hypothetical protein